MGGTLEQTQSLLGKLGWALLALSLLHSVSSARAFPSTIPPLAIWLLLPTAATDSLSPNYYLSILAYAAMTIVFDIIYASAHGSSITTPTKVSSAASGTKFAFAMYIIAMIFKVPVCFVLAKAHVKLGERDEAAGAGEGDHRSPIRAEQGGGYDRDSPYDPAPQSSRGEFAVGLGMGEGGLRGCEGVRV